MPSSPTRNPLQITMLLIVAAFMVALAVYVIGHDPIWCVILSAVLAGRHALTSGIWILRHVWPPRRSRICFAFHLSTAIWQGAPAALLTLLTLIVIEEFAGRPVNMDEVERTLMALFAAIVLSSIAGLLAAIAVVMTGVRVWVHPRFALMLERELKSAGPSPSPPPFNYGVFVLATSVTIPVIVPGGLLLVDPPAGWVLPVFMLVSFVFPIIMYRTLAARIFAAGPQEMIQHESC